MPVDILIFALIAAFLIYRLNSLLGTRHGDERQRRNPFAPNETVGGDADTVTDHAVIEGQAMPLANNKRSARTVTPVNLDEVIDKLANADGRIDTGLAEIAQADKNFDLGTFLQGARTAFEWIVTAYAKGDRETLKPLLSPQLYADFARAIDAREARNERIDLTLHRITAARVTEAHLGGTMAYITVDFDAEETVVTRDAAGVVIDGNPDNISTIADVWTFTKDARSRDPSWTLIETRTPDPK